MEYSFSRHLCIICILQLADFNENASYPTISTHKPKKSDSSASYKIIGYFDDATRYFYHAEVYYTNPGIA